MDLTEVVDALKAHFTSAENDAKTFLEQHLPVVANVASQAATNPALAAILSAVHLGDAPEFLQTIAKLVTEADAALAARHDAGVAEGTAAAQAAQAPAEAPPAEAGAAA